MPAPDPNAATAPGQYEGGARAALGGSSAAENADEHLREEIVARLSQARNIDSADVTVQVLGAKVILDGSVPDRYMRHAIEDLADAAPGVQDIENRLRVSREALPR